jgi:hypothetical protein
MYLKLLLFSVLLCGFTPSQSVDLRRPVPVDILIPSGMPVTIEATLDEDRGCTKYNITRHVASDVDRGVYGQSLCRP